MTVSPARLAANRANAQKSTGPRTAAGKFFASRNAIQHGLRSNRITVDQRLLDIRDRWAKDYPDANPAHLIRIAIAIWRIEQIDRLEDQLFHQAHGDDLVQAVVLHSRLARYLGSEWAAFNTAIKSIFRLPQVRFTWNGVVFTPPPEPTRPTLMLKTKDENGFVRFPQFFDATSALAAYADAQTAPPASSEQWLRGPTGAAAP